MDDPLPILAANLRRLREAQCLSQEALALSANMDPAEVRRIEGCKRDPGVRVLTRLAEALGTAPTELLADIPAPAED